MYANNELMTIAAAENGYVITINAEQLDETTTAKDAPVAMPEPTVVIAPTVGAVLACIKDKLSKLAQVDVSEDYDTAFKEASKNA